MTKNIKTLLFLLTLWAGQAWASGVVLIGHPGIPRLDGINIQKLYEGRIISVGGMAITVVNASPGTPIRTRFLTTYLGQDEETYTAYWTVRRFIGKGGPPRDLGTSSDIIRFVQGTPGAVGYIDAEDLKPGLNVLHTR